MDDQGTIRVVIQQWASAVRNEDLPGITRHHDPRIVMFDVPAPFKLEGLAAYEESWRHMFQWFRGTGRFEVEDLEITAGTDVAFAHGAIRCRGSELLTDDPELHIRLTLGLKKVDGDWVVTHEHHSEPARADRD